MYKSIFVISLIFCSVDLTANANDSRPGLVFASCTDSLSNGGYLFALEGYKKLESAGIHSAGLYNNMGVAYFKMNQLGNSLFYFEKGLRLAPLDTQLIYNRNKVSAKLGPAIGNNNFAFHRKNDSFFSLLGLLNKIAAVFIFGGGLFFLKIPSKVFFFLSLIFVLSLLIFYKVHKSIEYAIIITPKALVHLGPSENSIVDQIFLEGYEVEVNYSHGDWLEIKDYRGTSGWVRRSDLLVVE